MPGRSVAANTHHFSLSNTPILYAASGMYGLDPATVTSQTTDDGTTYSVSYKLGAAAIGTIWLNSNFFPDPTVANIDVNGQMLSILTVVNQTAGYSSQLTAEQLLEMDILHEFSHVEGRPDDENDPNATKQYNQKIIANCL